MATTARPPEEEGDASRRDREDEVVPTPQDVGASTVEPLAVRAARLHAAVDRVRTEDSELIERLARS